LAGSIFINLIAIIITTFDFKLYTFYHKMNIVNNKKQFRFEVLLPDGEYLTMEYRWLKGSMVLMHTVVPAAARGTGMGSAFVQQVLEHARSHNLKIIVYCPFVAKYMTEHPEYNDLIDDSRKL
jgi:predicted GNAT family acetyltransferase